MSRWCPKLRRKLPQRWGQWHWGMCSCTTAPFNLNRQWVLCAGGCALWFRRRVCVVVLSEIALKVYNVRHADAETSALLFMKSCRGALMCLAGRVCVWADAPTWICSAGNSSCCWQRGCSGLLSPHVETQLAAWSSAATQVAAGKRTIMFEKNSTAASETHVWFQIKGWRCFFSFEY